MSAGTWEYVMGVMYESNNTTPRYLSSGFNATTMPEVKYYDTYRYQGHDNSYNFNYHLGEATCEIL